MLKSKPILLFSILFSSVYMLLVLPWSDLSPRYADFYRNRAEFFFNKIGSSGLLLFERNDPYSTVITITQINSEIVNAGGKTDAVKHNIDIKILAYMPCALMVALFLATPIQFGKRLLLLTLGLAILHIFLMASLYIIILYQYAHAPVLKMFVPKKSGWTLIDMLECLVNRVTAQYSFLVICIWLGLLLLFQRRRLAEFKNKIVRKQVAGE